jgi:hypothetical protein
MSFKKFCTNQGYQVNTAEMNLDFESAGVEQLHHTIRTVIKLQVLMNSAPKLASTATYWKEPHPAPPSKRTR